MDYLQKTLLPKMQNFSENLDYFMNQLKEMREVIFQFDKTICMKSEKTDFTVFK